MRRPARLVCVALSVVAGCVGPAATGDAYVSRNGTLYRVRLREVVE